MLEEAWLHRWLAVGILCLGLIGCNEEPMQQMPTQLPILPAGSPRAPAAGASPGPTPPPHLSPRPSPSAAIISVKACKTPPPDVCCAVLYGALQGNVLDAAGSEVTTAKLTLRVSGGQLMGDCSDALLVKADEGSFAFNAVPFDADLILEATAPGFEPYRQSLRLPKGPLQVITVTLKRQTLG